MGSGHSFRMLRAPFQGKTWNLESDRPGLHSWLSQSLAPQSCTSPSNFDSLSAKWAERQETVYLSATGRLEGQSLPRVLLVKSSHSSCSKKLFKRLVPGGDVKSRWA